MIRTLAVFGRVDEIRTSPGLRRYGVPPGGAWDQDAWSVLQELGCEVGWETATTAYGDADPFWAFEALTLGSITLLGMSGRVVRNGQSFRLPCRLKCARGDRFELYAGRFGMRALVGASLQDAGRDALFEAFPEPEAPLFYVPIGRGDEIRAVISSRQDQMGIRLSGDFAPPPALAWSEPSVMGAIQMVEGGLLIHGPCGPTTGGYSKVGVVARASFSRLAQARPGDDILFSPVTLEEALLRREERHRSLHWWTHRIRVGLSVE